MKWYFMIPTSVGDFFLCTICNFYLKGGRSHRKKRKKGWVNDSRGKPQGKDWRYSTFCNIVIFCILNKIQLVSFYHLLVYLSNFFGESCLLCYISNDLIICCIIITHINFCSDLSLLSFCVNYVLNKFVHLIRIFIIATIKHLLILNVNF